MADSDAPVRPLLDSAAVREAMGATGEEFRTSTELVLGLDSWLRHYGTVLEM